MDYNLHDTTVLNENILSSEEREIWVLYMNVLTAAGLGDVSEWMKLDMSMPQMKVLMLLNNHGTLKVSDIAEKMGASLSNTTGLLDRLEKSGFIKRSHSETDRRSVVIQLTEDAKSIFRGLYEKGHTKLKRSLEKLTADEKAAVTQGLSILAKALAPDNAE
ncbi:MarR family transcriptional regulator [Bacillus atrophaeus]|uniref:MarR family transcriptional regulator n=1 Tax=Bacillus atrophaeus TaxID=1452 RepID=UPI002DB95E3F|nr:MarR family transcriptional regulator [Bacillus atrophaeus]MEC1903378.1 MarR family transcriptional regulator [Bacillus atrophaeus]MEC2398582.1 MarR family transcriptional regulator [Bacillus atrophaeus]MED4434914.1 MarR family transcriptional regulator [Bacillus atrophaeus]MED4566877.1 MarR family transcriptional regulator [Bacillus atrophaeus]MED4576443.1 MarR family transcriptional regulator [Bacillus atrophaeus]